LSIAEKLKAKGAGVGNKSSASNVSQQLTEVAKQQASSMQKPSWERFDMNKYNYEEEVKKGGFDNRHAVMAAINDDRSEQITDTLSFDRYREEGQGGPSADDLAHMNAIFSAPSKPSSNKQAAEAPSAPKLSQHDIVAMGLDGATVVGLVEEEDAPAQTAAANDGARGWKERIKKAKATEQLNMDRRQKRLEQAKLLETNESKHQAVLPAADTVRDPKPPKRERSPPAQPAARPLLSFAMGKRN